jgi:hypothetical protein
VFEWVWLTCEGLDTSTGEGVVLNTSTKEWEKRDAYLI